MKHVSKLSYNAHHAQVADNSTTDNINITVHLPNSIKQLFLERNFFGSDRIGQIDQNDPALPLNILFIDGIR